MKAKYSDLEKEKESLHKELISQKNTLSVVDSAEIKESDHSEIIMTKDLELTEK